ncbi:MAG: AMP-binding protein [Frankiaceae bacterium]
MPDAARAARPGEIVALVVENGPSWLDGYRALLAAGAIPLLLDSTAPEEERARWLRLAGGTRALVAGANGALRLISVIEGTATDLLEDPTVLLCTSGTTGAPKVVRRTVESLRAEGRRYVGWADLTAADRIALPLPMWHAYALGWVHAADEAGCAVHPCPSAALGRAVQSLETGATVVALVPSLAGLIAARVGRSAPPRLALRLAVVGAGPVSRALEEQFCAAFGIDLARNYGSTETGALFAGAPGSPDGVVGYPMDGIDARIVGADGELVPDGEPGALHVRVDGGPWRPMGDVVVVGPHGLRVVGRESRAVRRGDRWVAPEEVEDVLMRHPSVVDARCREVPCGAGRTLLQADVVGTSAGATDIASLRAHLTERLAPHKVPERIRLVGQVERGPWGKLRVDRRFRLGPAADLIAAANAYKRSELLFAMMRLGIVERLDREPLTVGHLAAELGLDMAACEVLVTTAAELGLVLPVQRGEADAAPSAEVPAAQAGPLLRLEERLSTSVVTRDALVAVATGGAPACVATLDETLAWSYHRAMHGPGADRRTRAGLALAGFRPGRRLLEVTCGPGRYAAAACETDARLIAVGTPDPDGGADLDAPADDATFDVVVVTNAVHLSGAGSDLARLAGRLRPGGRLLVEDVFLGEEDGVPGVVRLDWLTHGGLSWPTVDALRSGLARVGLAVGRTVSVGNPAVTLVVATHQASRSDA